MLNFRFAALALAVISSTHANTTPRRKIQHVGSVLAAVSGLAKVTFFPGVQDPLNVPARRKSKPPPRNLQDRTWIQIGEINGENAGDQFSRVSLSSDGSCLAVGAPNNDGNNGTLSGHVRVYDFDAGGKVWIQKGSDIDGEAAGDTSGSSVSISSDGSIVAIGARYNNGSGEEAGHVRVYGFDGSDWIRRGDDIDGEMVGDRSGESVCMSYDGTVVAVGASSNNGNGEDAGHVRVFKFDGRDWIQRGSDIDGAVAGAITGSYVSMSSDGSIVATGAFSKDENGDNTGHVRVYEFDGSNSLWTQKGSDIEREDRSDQFDLVHSLSFDGTVLAIGSFYNDNDGGSDAGHVRVYDFKGGDWIQRGNDIDGEARRDTFGRGLSLSSDGSVVAVGAAYNDGSDGPDTSNAGHVRVYGFNGADWILIGAAINGEAAEDRSGYSVSLSSDGSIVAIGAPFNGGNGDKSGHARIYKFRNDDALFDWSITATNATQVKFGDEFLDEEMVLTYTISKKDYKVTVMTEGCTYVVPPDIISLRTIESDITTTEKKVTVKVDINVTNLEGSSVWTKPPNANPEMAYIDFCIRFDLMYGVESMHFLERDVSLGLNTTVGNFNTAASNMNRNEGEAINADINTNYAVEACQCTSSLSCVLSPEEGALTQGSTLGLCLKANSAEVVVYGIEELTISQFTSGNVLVQQQPVLKAQSSSSSLTAVNSIDDAGNQNELIIQTQLMSRFFEDQTPLTVSGVARLAFNNRRKLEAEIVDSRNLQLESEDSVTPQFNVQINLKVDLERSSDGTFVTCFSAVSFVIAILLLPAISAILM